MKINKSIVFGIFLLMCLTALTSVTQTIYWFEPVQKNHKHQVNEIVVSGKDGYYDAVIGSEYYKEVYNRINSFRERYEYEVKYNKIHSTNAAKILNILIQRLDSGGVIYLSGNFDLTETVHINQSDLTLAGGTFYSTANPTFKASGIGLHNVVIRDIHIIVDYSINATLFNMTARWESGD